MARRNSKKAPQRATEMQGALRQYWVEAQSWAVLVMAKDPQRAAEIGSATITANTGVPFGPEHGLFPKVTPRHIGGER